jgi:hypothetical protein
MSKVKVRLSHPRDGKRPGDTVEVSEVEARQLIRGGFATPARVTDARKVGAPAATAASKQTKAS